MGFLNARFHCHLTSLREVTSNLEIIPWATRQASFSDEEAEKTPVGQKCLRGEKSPCW